MKVKTKFYLYVLGLIILLSFFGFSFAYFTSNIINTEKSSVNVAIEGVPALTFINDNDINIVANQDNFQMGSGNLKSNSTASAILNSQSTYTDSYSAYFYIDSNNYTYTTNDEKAELLLKITKPDGTNFTSIAGLNYVTINGESGFDITTKTGQFLVVKDYEISVIGNSTTQQDWQIEVVLVNLDTNQKENENKTLHARFELMKTGGYIFTGTPQTFTATQAGLYNVELWGAQGGTRDGIGYGAYTSGEIFLNKDETIYVYVGEYPSYTSGSCYSSNANNAFNTSTMGSCAGGGGATDIRLVGGNWSNPLSLNSRIMVAGGGGGTIYSGHGGSAGGLISYPGVGTGGNSGYAVGLSADQMGTYFGYAFNSTTIGGGGYYGGAGGYGGNASGGSSYISGHTGCVAIAEGSTTNPRAVKIDGCTTGINNKNCAIHYSNKMFTNTKMIDGDGYTWSNIKGIQEQMPNPTGGYYSLGQGNEGNGFARITFIGNGEIKDYVYDGILVHYDGIKNAETGHGNSNTSWYDVTGNGRNGVLYNVSSSSWTEDGLELDGVNDYVKFNNPSYSILPSAHEFTLEYVVTLRETTGSYFSVNGLNHHYWVLYHDNYFRSMNRNVSNTANNWPLSARFNVTPDKTYTFTETYTSNNDNTFTVAFYYNGIKLKVSSSVTSAVANYNFQYLSLGIEYNSTAYYKGNLKSVRIYDRPLSQAEIYHNYGVDSSRFNY